MTIAEAAQPTATLIIDQAIQQAIAFHQDGKLPEAEHLYRIILQIQPDHEDTQHNLSLLAEQIKQISADLPDLMSALEVDPSQGKHWLAYAEALLITGQATEAQLAVDTAMRCGLDSTAIKTLRQRIEDILQSGLATNNSDVIETTAALDQNNLSQVELQAEDISSDLRKKTSQLITLLNAGRYDELENHAHLFLDQHPNTGSVWKILGAALQIQGKDALHAMQKAAALLPNDDEAHSNLSVTLAKLGHFDEAESSCRRALQIQPNSSATHNNLGNILRASNQFDAALVSYRRALDIQPDYRLAYGNILFTNNYHPDLSAEAIFQDYQEYDARYCVPFRSTWSIHNNDLDPNRRLRIGYVSPDFKRHSCQLFLEPLLAHHDKTQVEVYAYAELAKEDEVTARYKTYVDHWVPTGGMNDETLSKRIRNDGIDILIDLAGHTEHNRLPVFARKPAPVSLSWLGYGYTTGLSAIDYYLTDETCVPVGSEQLFSEQPWRIATPTYVYRPNPDMGEVSPLPALQRGHITFGTLTRSVRINHRTMRVWSELLKAVSNSRLVIDSASFKTPAMQDRLAAKFFEYGIERDRLEIGSHSPPWDVLRGIDIGLDCFPHNSGTTLFETLFMGVPCITLAGRPSVGRLGSSVLQGAGHPEWIAKSEDEYITKGVELANDLNRLSEIRSELRGQMKNGPLGDEKGFALKVEAAYRKIWQNWCEQEKKS